MAEIDNNNSEPQKPATSAFKGVPLPQNNNVHKSSGTSKPGHTTNDSPKPASPGEQVSKNSIVSKLNQSEDSSDKAEQNQTANGFPKKAFNNQKPRSPLINNLPQPGESLKQPDSVVRPGSGVIIESAESGLLQRIKDKLFTPQPGVSSTRQKAMVIMVPILAIIMIFAFRQVLFNAPSQTEGAGMDDETVVANTDTGHDIDWKIPEPITITSRDPIKLPGKDGTQNPEQAGKDGTTGGTETSTRTIIVKDIVYSKDKPSAVIGSKIIYVGDVINDVTIVKIDRDSVEFEKNGQRWEQKVREGKKIPVEVTSQNQDQSESTE